MTDDVPAIVAVIARAVMVSNRESIKRLRFAVTPQEFAEIRQYCLARDGKFYQRIRNVPLIVEQDPDNPDLYIEVAQDG